ncbi:hypothetical protein AALP_AA8G359700 [Arabis alpina]|uniref:Glabrous enhancer-binding protein-like C-terminal domain-containing protein n=1 Tax=Arabis alpina TaxID=50452 RepID=A0A087GBL4_ARAAL|nr:hypothetical protein AALP_AA8G359700 [Arabis alpina]
MAKEDPHARDENELEIGVEEMQTDSDVSSDSEPEFDLSEAIIGEQDWFDFENDYIAKIMATLDVSEESMKEKWSMLPMESKPRFEEEWREIRAKEIELALKKTKLIRKMISQVRDS